MKINNHILKLTYNEYRKIEAFKKCNNYTMDTINYIKNNNIIDKNDISINADFVHWFNILSDVVYNNEIVEKYNALSNNKKRNLLCVSMLYTLKLKYKFDRGASVYNKDAKTYAEKRYTLTDTLSVNDFLKNVGMILKGDIIIK